MKKIYFVSPFYPYRGGIAQFSDVLSSHLSSTSRLFKINYKRLYPAFLFPGKSQFVPENDKKKIQKPKNGIDSINPFSLIKAIRSIKIDSKENILLNVYWMSFFAPILIFLSFLTTKKVKKVSIIHNLIPHEPRFFDKILTRIYLNQQDAFIVLSDKVKQDILNFKPKAKVLKLFHPLYEHFGKKIQQDIAREKYGISSNKKVALFFGLIRDYKGLDVLLNSFRYLDDTFVLIIAGECYGGFSSYQSIVDKYELRNRIIHLDYFISDEEVPFLFSSVDVCVLPYKKATQSGVAATAIHFETPIVSSNVGGLSEYVIDGKNGLLVAPNNEVELANAIKKACDKHINHSMVDETVLLKGLFSWEKFTIELTDFIDTLC